MRLFALLQELIAAAVLNPPNSAIIANLSGVALNAEKGNDAEDDDSKSGMKVQKSYHWLLCQNLADGILKEKDMSSRKVMVTTMPCILGMCCTAIQRNG